jgi:hypothetical protein
MLVAYSDITSLTLSLSSTARYPGKQNLITFITWDKTCFMKEGVCLRPCVQVHLWCSVKGTDRMAPGSQRNCSCWSVSLLVVAQLADGPGGEGRPWYQKRHLHLTLLWCLNKLANNLPLTPLFMVYTATLTKRGRCLTKDKALFTFTSSQQGYVTVGYNHTLSHAHFLTNSSPPELSRPLWLYCQVVNFSMAT